MKKTETAQHETNVSEAKEKQEAFEQQQDVMEVIKRDGFAEYAKKLNLSNAFDLEKNKPAPELHRCICCMDGRTPFGVHAAGSGMLLSDAEFNKLFKESGADSISSHTGCGAAKLYAKKMGLEGDTDEIAKEWSKKKAKELGVKYTHLEVDKPFHYERVCYYDGTGKFNYKQVEALPYGFVVNRKNMTKEASLAEAGVAKNIIFGDHGFGELLTQENPFVFVAVAQTQEELERLKAELLEITKEFGDKVTVDGFIAPTLIE